MRSVDELNDYADEEDDEPSRVMNDYSLPGKYREVYERVERGLKKLNNSEENSSNNKKQEEDMTFEEFQNESDREFTDISSEELRYYEREGKPTKVIHDPIALATSNSAHYVADSRGVVHRIAFSKTEDDVTWIPESGQPNVVT